MANAKVLLASSAKICLESMRRYLKDLNLWILTAEDGLSALQMAQRHRPHLIFMDVNLAGKSGVECCWQLRSAAYGKKIPIVLISTGHTWDTDACLAAGCSDILNNPLDQGHFLSLTHKLLGSYERRESRIPCRALVNCHSRTGNFYGTMEDISAHGIFIGTDEELKKGEDVRIRFLLPWQSGEPIVIDSTVSWINRGRHRQRTNLPEGFGVVFHDPPPHFIDQIEKYIEHNFLLLNPPGKDDI